jgi:hypothetical protein
MVHEIIHHAFLVFFGFLREDFGVFEDIVVNVSDFLLLKNYIIATAELL